MRALAGVNEPDIYVRKYLLKEAHLSVPQPKEGHLFRGLEESFIEEEPVV